MRHYLLEIVLGCSLLLAMSQSVKAAVPGDVNQDGVRGLEDAVIILQELAGIPHDWDKDGVSSEIDCNESDPKMYPGAEEVCDGKDNDCDTAVDEDTCDEDEEQDQDEDGWTAESDCDDVNPKIFPGAGEQCDGIDNNCNETIDEDTSRQCYTGPAGTSGTGVCKKGSLNCENGEYSSCTGEITPADEVCDGKDNNCNGMTDENISHPCYTGPAGTVGTGLCQEGIANCENGEFPSCAGEITPADELCDDLDNNCNGQVDEGCE